MEDFKSNRYLDVVAQSEVTSIDEVVEGRVQEILSEHFAENNNRDVYRFLLNTVDLTTLSSEDTETSVAEFTRRVNEFETNHPELDNVAAICVYPNFASVVRANLDVSEVNVAVVGGNFPSSQARIEVKVAECTLAVADGADEVDIVYNLGLDGDECYEELCDEIQEIKDAIGDAHLKVILETGALKSAANIKRASILSMYSGADFIKTSTGKIYPGASLEAAYVMCSCIKEYYEKCGRMVGFKVSGGVRTTEEAVKYYTLVKEILGEEWLTNAHFRIGASSLANNLFASITGTDEKPF